MGSYEGKIFPEEESELAFFGCEGVDVGHEGVGADDELLLQERVHFDRRHAL